MDSNGEKISIILYTITSMAANITKTLSYSILLFFLINLMKKIIKAQKTSKKQWNI